MVSSLLRTFLASLRSVGAAGTLAAGGVYLHRKGVLDEKNKKLLALFSQQLAIPALFFTNIVNCPQDWSGDKCPNVLDQMNVAWILVFWPIFVVGTGLMVGEVAARVSGTPKCQRRCVLAACAFGNSSGLPITLLTVIQSNLPPISRSNGMVDPSLLLSIYLLIYPILQWGVGGWLLTSSSSPPPLLPSGDQNKSSSITNAEIKALQHQELNIELRQKLSNLEENKTDERIPLTGDDGCIDASVSVCSGEDGCSQGSLDDFTGDTSSLPAYNKLLDVLPIRTETISNILSKALQPPVVAALFGLLVSSMAPLRGIFVDIKDRDDDALLEWAFDGLTKIGNAAVPVNMSILGCNLSIAWQHNKSHGEQNSVSTQTIAAVVVAKLIVMPCIGIFSAFFLQYFLILPDDVSPPFYLVLMLVTVTPTANNVMVMVELYGSGMKEGIAKIIGWQYVVAPVVLSVAMMFVMQIAQMN